jgi:hypothetical protein
VIDAEKELRRRRVDRMRLEALAATGTLVVSPDKDWMSAPHGSVALHIYPADYPDQGGYIIRGDGKHELGSVTSAGTTIVTHTDAAWARAFILPGETYLLYRAVAPRVELIDTDGETVDVIVGEQVATVLGDIIDLANEKNLVLAQRS